MNNERALRSAETRLDLCENLLTMTDRIAAASGNLRLKVMLTNRAQAARRVLLGRGSGSDMFLNPKAGVEALRDAMEGLEGKSEVERQQISHHVRGIYLSMRALFGAEARHTQSSNSFGLPDDLMDLLEGAIGVLGDDDKARERADPMVDESIAAGAFGADIRGELAAAEEKAKTGGGQALTSLQKMLSEKFDGVAVEQKKRRDALMAFYANMDAKTGPEEYERLKKEYNEWLYEVYTPVSDAKKAEILAHKASVNAVYSEIGQKMVAKVLDRSQISEEDATAWAGAQVITKAAAARLKKLGYQVDQVRRDMAEFYRITQGRVATVNIDSNGDRRANATDIEAHGKVGTINLGSNFDKRVLWHELAHHIEADPAAKISAGRFIRRRSEDGKVYSLRSLTGNDGYGRNEGAFKGGFFSAYVGKRYQDGITEVFAMGVESFSNPEMLARRASQDPETLEFVAGFISKPMSPLAKAHQGLRELLQEMEQEAVEVTGNWVENRIKDMAAGVTIEKTTDTSWLGDVAWMVSKYQQVAHITDTPFYIFKGKVRNPATWRKVNGLLIVQLTDRGIKHYEFASTDIDAARAAYAYYQMKGVFPTYNALTNESELRKAMP